MTYGHLQADCLYTGISSGPNARYRVWEAFTFTFLHAGVIGALVMSVAAYLNKEPVIGDDETEQNDGTDADQRLESVRIERLLQHHTDTSSAHYQI